MISGVSSIVVTAPQPPEDLLALLTGPFGLSAKPFSDASSGVSGHRIPCGDSAIETWTPAEGSHLRPVLAERGWGLGALIFRGTGPASPTLRPWTHAGVVNGAILVEPSEATHQALVGARNDQPGNDARHPIVECIDHVVISSGDSAATAATFSQTFDIPIKRKFARPGSNNHLEFMKLGQVVLEFGGPPEPRPGPHTAKYWGFVLTVWDIDATVAAIRDGGWPTTDPRPAVQPGAKIAAVKERTGGVPFALIQYNAIPVEQPAT